MNTALDQFRMKKALIVEDHPDMVEILTLQLEILGFAVISANNGTEGVEKAIKERPHLILMDIMMPGMDGRDATRFIRCNPETKDIPILVATALSQESDLRSCIEAGCNDYLVKPFTLKQLQRKILEYISPSNPTIH
ncbi:MAG: response regulator [Candidatus Binatia bacterium]